MTKKRTGLIAMLALLALAAGSPAHAQAAPAAERIGVEMTIRRADGGGGQYVCRTTVRDLAAQAVLAEPEFRFRMGENATARSSGEGYEVEVSAFVSGGGAQVDHVVVVRRKGQVTAAQSMTFHLPL
ncbi:MAG: hypothetical protein H6Q03_402 [Acidobacteria bacterium]|nr:hypothetical protein [Acidobacteriota bacterium]